MLICTLTIGGIWHKTDIWIVLPGPMTVAIEGVGVVCKIISSFSCWETLIHWSKASNFSKFSWLVNDYSLLLCSRNLRFLCWRNFSRKKGSKCFTCWERSDSFRVNDHIKRRHWGDKKETRWSGWREKKESQDEILNSSNKGEKGKENDESWVGYGFHPACAARSSGSNMNPAVHLIF